MVPATPNTLRTSDTSSIQLAVPTGFGFPQAICSYGYFLLAPNRWVPEDQTFYRVLRGKDDRLVQVSIRQIRPGGKLLITCCPKIDRDERELLLKQIRRMIRLDEDPAVLKRWRKLHPQARKAGFATMFRSPTLFEDIIKTMTSCNVTWPNTMRMNQLMSQHVGKGAFPTPGELARWNEADLKARCRVGYRAERIIRLARDVHEGTLDLSRFEETQKPTQEIYDDLLELHGIGPYAAGNLCHTLGRYDRLAIDTETYRHFREVHKVPTPENRQSLHPQIEAYYARFAPFQFLAYWFELWQSAQERMGPATFWDAQRHGPNFSATSLQSTS